MTAICVTSSESLRKRHRAAGAVIAGLLGAVIWTAALAEDTPMPPPQKTIDPAGKIDLLINPAGPHFVTLRPMPVRGSPCDPAFLTLGAELVTRQYSHIWRRNRPESVNLEFLSTGPASLGTEARIALDGAELHLAVATEGLGPGALGGACTLWRHRIALTRDQFREVAASTRVVLGTPSGEITLSADHLAGLRDLASRMEPEDEVVRPPDPAVHVFDGDLAEGTVYIATIEHRKGLGWWPSGPPIRLPAHHAASVEWLNLDAFPTLGADRKARPEIVFEVVRRDVAAVTPSRWNTTIQCRILKVMTDSTAPD